MINWESIASTVALIIVCAACVIHMAQNIDKSSSEAERWGFALTGAGALGTCIYMWWPKVESFPFELVMHVGMALIAVSMISGKVRSWMASARGFQWTDRRKKYD